MEGDAYSTIVYKSIGDLKIHFDLYHPRLETRPQCPKVPAVIYFHGGGLTVGNRKSWFPHWLCKRVNAVGFAFVCADYRLIPSGSTTGYEILQDIKDLFAFLPTQGFSAFGVSYQIDKDAMGVAGTSSGGLCAYLAAIHACPRPRAVLSMYGMGGNFFTSHYITLKTAPFFRGRELLDPSNFTAHIFPTSATSSPIADSPLEYYPLTSPTTPGYPANPRMLLTRLYLQCGIFLDYYTGAHEPSLSATLRTRAPPIPIEEFTLKHGILFPQMNVTGAWPPTLFVHGEIDTAVPADESRHLHSLLVDAGVKTEIIVIDGMEHSFDYAPDCEEKFGAIFDRIVVFLGNKLNG
ncbi:alpha/beta-hydrolase [Guyanagaster necrorhizus]|uniref:Alpha/beta-hydrolase n=1 Tax=Guyanagaster necrorhizus TaxID=856835 RepID=A0A9P7VSA6_9AGAR|nr:alpha/beta-hydrolase [Guyanagaster necrorhizus MCA 3950]KAG7445677.1 alpha/beta-hydrolase [Guyanagaster necrorhizus MCA 3950]